MTPDEDATYHGFSKRCQVCGEALWRLWVSDEGPPRICPWRALTAKTCPRQIVREENSRRMKAILKEDPDAPGLLPWPDWPRDFKELCERFPQEKVYSPTPAEIHRKRKSLH